MAIELASATAYRRKKGDLIAGIERCAPGGEFLIPRSYQRAAVGGELRAASDEAGEEILDAGAGADFDRFFAAAGDFLEAAEE